MAVWTPVGLGGSAFIPFDILSTKLDTGTFVLDGYSASIIATDGSQALSSAFVGNSGLCLSSDLSGVSEAAPLTEARILRESGVATFLTNDALIPALGLSVRYLVLVLNDPSGDLLGFIDLGTGQIVNSPVPILVTSGWFNYSWEAA